MTIMADIVIRPTLRNDIFCHDNDTHFDKLVMKLSLTEAARLLGKSPRQLRYLMKTGALKGEKLEGRWVFDESTLPVSPAREKARQVKAEELTAAVHEALEPQLKSARARGYSATDLVAFRTGCALCRDATQKLGASHPAATSLRGSVVALGRACHRFHHREKTEAFALAREEASAAVAHLHIEGTDVARALADAVEKDYLTALVGLLRRQERKDRHK